MHRSARQALALSLCSAALACAPSSIGSASVDPPAQPPGQAPPSDPILYVDAGSGRDTNDGRTRASAFQTLQRAVRAVKPGWTVKVMNGTYTTDGTTEPLLIDVSGTAGAWIVFTADAGQHPVIQIPRGVNGWSGIHVLGASYLIIDGFEIVGQGGSIGKAEASRQKDGSQALYNHNCIYVDGVGSAGVHPAVPHDVVIRNSVLRDCTAAGIEVNAGDAITIAHNKVQNTSWWTVFDTSGIGLYHLTDVASSTVQNGYKNFIVGNEVWGTRNEIPCVNCTPVAIYDGNGIIVDDTRHTQKALGANDVQGVPYTGRTYIANNIVHDNGGRGIHTYRSEHIDVVNNTVFNNLLTTSDYLTFGEIDAYDSRDVQLLNNIAVNLVGKDITFNDGHDGGRYDFNLYDGTDAKNRGANDRLAPALLVDPAKGNYAPQASSPAIKSGTSELAPTNDFFGNPRPAGAVDRGAIQVSQ